MFNADNCVKPNLVAVGLVLVLSACSDDSNNVSKQNNQNRRKWEALNSTRYQFTYTRQCECFDKVLQPRLVLVDGGEVSSQVVIASAEALDPEVYSVYSIEGLFDLIAIEAGQADSVVVEYDTSLGYPMSVSIDPNSQIADDEFSVRVSDLVLDEDIGCTTSYEPGISLTVSDNSTGEPVNCGITVYANDGDDTLVFNNDGSNCDNSLSVNVLYENPGFYDLTIRKEGYIASVVEDVGIGANLCHVITRQMNVDLTAQ